MDNNCPEKSIQLVIASNNVHKIHEFRTMLHNLQCFDVYSLKDFPTYQPPEETGNTFEENAIIKATHAAKTLGIWAIGDDSGLIVPALNGQPGVYSSRFAGKDATDKENRKKLLSMMETFSDEQRNAYFECCIAFASPTSLIKSTCAICEGKILTQERGGNGFGYDPLFVKHDYGKTFAELEPSVKNKISHRRKAFDKIICTLESYSS